MLNLHNSQALYKLTGLSISKFDLIIDILTPLINSQKIPPPRRKMGGGRKHKITIKEQLLLTLMYKNLEINCVQLGNLFKIHNSNVSRYKNKIIELLIKIKFKFPKLVNEDMTVGRIQEIFETLDKTGHHTIVKELFD